MTERNELIFDSILESDKDRQTRDDIEPSQEVQIRHLITAVQNLDARLQEVEAE